MVKRLRVTNVAGNVGVNRAPISRAIKALLRSEKAAKQVKAMAEKGKER